MCLFLFLHRIVCDDKQRLLVIPGNEGPGRLINKPVAFADPDPFFVEVTSDVLCFNYTLIIHRHKFGYFSLLSRAKEVLLIVDNKNAAAALVITE